MKTAAIALTASCVLLTSAHADILTVGGPGGTYTEIADAVSAALDGDTILVSGGSYLGFTVDAKSLTIEPAPQVAFYSTGEVTIINIGVGQSVLFKLPSDARAIVDRIEMTDCLGTVRIEGGYFWGFGGNTATNCAGVIIEGSTFRGHDALRVTDSFAAVYRSTLHGWGGAPSSGGAAWGYPGLRRFGTGAVFLSESTAEGAPGDDAATGIGGGAAGWGGDGVSAPGKVTCLGCTLIGGLGGIGVVSGQDGLPLNTGTIVAGPARLVEASPIVFDNATIELTFEGLPGEQVSYAASDSLQYVQTTQIGPLLVSNPQWVPVGVIPAGGTLNVTHAITSLPNLERADLYFQGRMTGGALTYLTNASRTVILARGLDDCSVLDTPLGTEHCSPNTPNSTGQSGRLSARGSHCVSNNQVVLAASALPQNEFGYVLNSTGLGMIANPGGALGNLCLGGGQPIGRHNAAADIRFSGQEGAFELVIDMTNLPTPTGSVSAVAGQGWAFQVWHRDGSGSSFTNAVAISFH